MAFLKDSKELVIFVLKSKELSNSTWTAHNFDSDLRKAAAPDLSPGEFKEVEKVTIILAYNKDEDKAGVTLYDNLVSSMPKTISEGVSLFFERWNLTKLVEEVRHHLLSPELLPGYLTSALTYICMQYADFNYGTHEWEKQLVPQWKFFLENALEDPVTQSKVLLVPVVLLIVHNYPQQIETVTSPGWIDLVEWAMLALWEKYDELEDESLQGSVVKIWVSFYVVELEKYFQYTKRTLSAEHGLCSGEGVGAGSVGAVKDAHVIYWHLARIGILTLAQHEFLFVGINEENNKLAKQKIEQKADWLIELINANPAVFRPLIDLHHIQLFLLWIVLLLAERYKDIYSCFYNLLNFLLTRRMRLVQLPFIESYSQLDLVAEYAATSLRPAKFFDSSSYLLLMVLELCFSLDEEQRDELLALYVNRIVKGLDVEGNCVVEHEIYLHGWIPPEDWEKRILKEKVTDGTAVDVRNFNLSLKEGDEGEYSKLADKIKDYVEKTREQFPRENTLHVPPSVLILGCLKHESPLPPLFWRYLIFNNEA